MAASLDSILLALIIDHCKKNGWHAAADRLRADALDKACQGVTLPPAFCNGPNSFLTDWFGMFWDFFRKRANSSFAQPIGVQLGAALGRPPQSTQQAPDRAMNFNRTPTHSAPFPNGYSRPPHHPGNMRAGPATVQRTANTPVTPSAVPRRAPTPPFGVMHQPFPMHSVQPDLNMNDALGQMMAANASSPQQMTNIRQMRHRPNTTSPGYRPPAPPTPTRRSTAESSSHMHSKVADLQRAAALNASVGSKKRASNSPNVSLDSMQSPGAAMSSASLAAYGKAGAAHPQPNGPKKRMRNSTGYPENHIQQMMSNMNNMNPHHIRQARLHAAQNAEMQNQRMQGMGMRTSQQQQQLRQRQQHQEYRIRMDQVRQNVAQGKQGGMPNGSRGVLSAPPNAQMGKSEGMGSTKGDAPASSGPLGMESLGLLANEPNAAAVAPATASQINAGTNEPFTFPHYIGQQERMQQQQQQASNGSQAVAATASMTNPRTNSRTSPQTRQRATYNSRAKKNAASNNRGSDSSQSGRPSGGGVASNASGIPQAERRGANSGPNNSTGGAYAVAGTTRENSARAASAPGTSSEMMSRMASAANGRKAAEVSAAAEQDKQGGGGTPSQRSGVSGVSGGATNKRPAKTGTGKRRGRTGRKKGAASPDAPKKSVPQPPPQQPPAPPPPPPQSQQQQKAHKAIPPDEFPLDLGGHSSFLIPGTLGSEEFEMLSNGLEIGGIGMDGATSFDDNDASYEGV